MSDNRKTVYDELTPIKKNEAPAKSQPQPKPKAPDPYPGE